MRFRCRRARWNISTWRRDDIPNQCTHAAAMIYFAYGSNLLKERLQARCPRANWIGRGTIEHYRLTFDKISTDESGKCAFESSPGSDLPGVLWEIDDAERAALDRLEGAGRGYEADTVAVVDATGAAIQAMTYRATKRMNGLQPYDWYWALVAAGARQNSLPHKHLDALNAQPYFPDPKLHRETRVEAMHILRCAGYMHVLEA